MFEILKKQKVAENTYLMEVLAPAVARKAKPGNFIMLRIDEAGERIPLTIADYNKKTVTIIFLVVGKTTKQLSALRKGDVLFDFVGPLGNESEIAEFGTVCLVGGGLGMASLYLIGKAFKKAGNNVISIMGAKNKKFLFWEDHYKAISDNFIICTDDGSKGRKGFVSEALNELMRKKKINRVIAIGPTIMMKVVANLTKDRIKTIASLNPIMIDGMGMCGCCMVIIDEEVRFACVDGPEFDAHKVDWDELMNRNKTYLHEEKCSCGDKNG
jgi:NAD(P)H-flavin reductase